MDALFGHTGFVGSCLKENLTPKKTAYFNSNNVRKAKGRAYKNVYCACIPGQKWKANLDPEDDLKNINDALNVLKSLTCQRFILISTIDVHDHSHERQDESCEFPSAEPYGKHRLMVEDSLYETYGEKLTVIRLPALFGVGLKKNVLFDLLNDNLVGNINVNSSYQWYPLSKLWGDIVKSQDEMFTNPGKQVLNIYPETIETSDIINIFFPEKADQVKIGKRVVYNHVSKFNQIFAYKQGVVLSEMEKFIKMYRKFWAHDSQISGNYPCNRLVVSNMAWDPVDDHHAIFLLKRYGITHVEIMPTKYFSWENTFEKPTFHEKFEKAGIKVYSLQSVLHGVDGNFFDNPKEMTEHLRKVMSLCDSLDISRVVMGSPKKRVVPKVVGRASDAIYEEKLGDVLNECQKGYTSRLCLEPNAGVYGCDIGKNLHSCSSVAKGNEFGLNFDTGNFMLENDSTGLVEGIEHCQISAPMLRPVRIADYVNIRSSMTGYHLKNLKKDVKISLEIKVDKIENLGENIRRFVMYMSEYV